jgi:hypothetical protein
MDRRQFLAVTTAAGFGATRLEGGAASEDGPGRLRAGTVELP